jgi:hypothetical protein
LIVGEVILKSTCAASGPCGKPDWSGEGFGLGEATAPAPVAFEGAGSGTLLFASGTSSFLFFGFAGGVGDRLCAEGWASQRSEQKEAATAEQFVRAHADSSWRLGAKRCQVDDHTGGRSTIEGVLVRISLGMLMGFSSAVTDLSLGFPSPRKFDVNRIVANTRIDGQPRVERLLHVS